MKSNKMLDSYCTVIEKALESYLPEEDCLQADVIKAMKYSLLDGGKRIRPALLLEFYRLCGGDVMDALPFACAVEMIHTYSLIHDDLPCMDDDDYRRGKLTCHKMFSEEIALLAGDALLTLAFQVAATASAQKIKNENIIKCISRLSAAAGVNGMVGGQVIDLESEGKEISLSVLEQIHQLKTAAMIVVSAEMGCILADADEAKINAAIEYSKSIGLAFQIKDDILDVIGDSKELGKNTGSDTDNNKSTYVTILGIEKSCEIINELNNKAKNALSVFSDDAKSLIELSELLATRTS